MPVLSQQDIGMTTEQPNASAQFDDVNGSLHSTADPQPPLRLSLPFPYRLPLSVTLGFLTGAALGLGHGSTTANLRFRAENAHRLPTTQTGWYLYHKSKNYHVILGGIKEGMKMGTKTAFWVGSFFVVEEAVDRLRESVAAEVGKDMGGRRDFLSTVIAGLGIAGGWSLWNRFPMITAARTAKHGLRFGLFFGLAQDALNLARGNRLAYVDFLLGGNRRRAREAESQKLEKI